MEQALPARNGATEGGQEGEVRTSTTRASGNGGLENAAEVSFEVWQFRMYHRYHSTLGCCIFFVAGLLAMCVPKEVHANLLGTMIIAAILPFLRYAAHRAANQALAHRVMEYSAFAMLAIRITVGNRAIPEGSFEPLEMCLQAYGWDIVRPVALSVLAPTLPMRPAFMVILLFMYAVRLSVSIETLMVANNLDNTADSLASGLSVPLKSVLPISVFLVSVFANLMSMRQSRSLYTHVAKLQKALHQEVLANEHAIRCEQRAHEAETQVYEERLQQRNKYLGAMCHDFGTPVAVLQMLLLMLRKRMLRDQERERRAAAAEEEQEAAAAAFDLHAPRMEADVGRGMAKRPAPVSSVGSASSSARSNVSFGASSNANIGGNLGARPLESYEDSARMLDVIRRASAGLELLEVTRQKAIAYSKLQAGGRLVPDCKPFEMAELMRKSASIAQDTGKSDRVMVRTHVNGDFPLVVNSDSNWLYMILVNFASNSMKHTRQGSVTISATRLGRLRLRLEVSDTGSGVPAEFVPLLFQPFSSASTTATSVESTGLGLYHSKQLAGILGGKVGYRPNVGGGSVFYVEVPMALVTPEKTEEVLAKNRLDFGDLEATKATPERGTRGGQHRKAVCRAGKEKDSSDRAHCAVGTAPCASRPIPSFKHVASTSSLDPHPGEDAAEAASRARSCDAPPPLPPPLPPPPPPQIPSHAATALTASPVSHQFVPSEPLTSLLSRVPPPLLSRVPPPLLSRVPPPLIIDDSELARSEMREQLSAWAGAVPMEAEGGEEGLRMLTTEQRPMRPSILLLAVHMLELNGPATCRAIRKWEQSRGVAQRERLRIVGLLTFSNDAAGRAACLDAGMDDAIGKPFDAATLHSTLRKLLR